MNNEEDNNFDSLIPINLEDEMKRSYLDYAMSVIVSRAIPDVRDGLKPVHRRILYAMHEAGYTANKQHRKSARIVGDVIGKYHPHGDTAVYDSLVRMAQDFALRAPLVDGQGNFGSIDGDSAAAMRYTESRLSKISHNLLEDLDKETVDFIPNYDGLEIEPKVLPAMFPNLLVNGTSGIAVGMATNIPPHNLGEIIDACCMYVDNEDVEISDLLSCVKGPDFPTSGTIMGMSGIRSAYLTGRGSIIIRGKTEIESIANNRESIIITEIPYAVNKAKLVEKIADLVKEKRIENISDLRDESNKKGIRIVIELKKDANSAVILNQLYSYTSLQTSFGVIMLALDNGMPKVMNLKEVIVAFVKFRELIITKRTIYLLNKARDRAHILFGIIIAVSNIDEIVSIIKAAKDPLFAKESLMNKKWNAEFVMDMMKIIDDKSLIYDKNYCSFSELQAKAILEMRLQRLTGMEKDKILKDINDLSIEIKGYLEILDSRDKLLSILKEELLYVRTNFATERLTSIEIGEFEQDIEDLIPKEEMVVTVTLSGYIKRVPLATYRAQNRGGKGRSGLSMRDEDFTTQVIVGSTHTPLLFFSNLGQVYSLKLYKLPIGTPQTKGRPMINIFPLKEGEVITNIMKMPENETNWDDLNIMFATAKGNVRRNDLSDFKKIQANGKIAIRLEEYDRLINVKVCEENDDILLATKHGKAVRFGVSAVRLFKSRTSDGVRGIKLSSLDKVISMTVLKTIKTDAEEREQYLSIDLEKRLAISNGEEFDSNNLGVNLSHERIIAMAQVEEFILTATENGFGKKSSAFEYRVTNRGGTGVININSSNKTGDVVAVTPVSNRDELMLITVNGKLIRCKLDNVRTTGRNTTGVILFKNDPNDKVISASLIIDGAETTNEEENND